MANSSHPASASLPDEEWVQQLNQQQMFTLMDQLLPFEACLYYEVLPLSLEGSRLNLGMVDPDDTAASDYVRRLLSYINCSIVTRPISSSGHRAMLTRYLNQSQSQSQQAISSKSGQTRSRSTPIELSSNPDSQRTFVVDRPEHLPEHSEHAASAAKRPPQTAKSTDAANRADDEHHSAHKIHNSNSDRYSGIESVSSLDDFDDDFDSLDEIDSADADFEATLALEELEQERKQAKQAAEQSVNTASADETVVMPDAGQASGRDADNHVQAPPPPIAAPTSKPEPLEITLRPSSQPIEVLMTLTPKQIVDELLARVLHEGIGRLYLEHHADSGRILWSQNGVLQSVVERLDLARFHGVIIELKRMVGLPMLPVRSAKRADLERIYQQDRLLLRFRITPGLHGEEATLQVLRGAALKFYEQQMAGRLERDALGLAHRLQQQLEELRDRGRSRLMNQTVSRESLLALHQLLCQLDEQVQEMMNES